MTPEEQAALAAEGAALEGEYIPGPGAGASTEEPTPGPSTGQVLALIFKPLFDVLAPNWKVEEAECVMLGDAYGAVVDKYFPDLDLGVELGALVATVVVFGPRMKIPRKPEPEPKPQQDGDLPNAPAA